MKKLIFIALYTILVSNAFLVSKGYAQSKTSSGKPPVNLNHKTVDIELSSPYRTESQPARFSRFEVLDARPDTSFIGVHTEILWLPANATRMRQLALKGTVNRALPDYFNNNFTDPKAPYKVLVVIRKLWVSDVTYTHREREQKKEQKQTLDLKDDKINLRLRAEIYVSRDDKPLYAPLLRYDSLLVLDKTGYNRVGYALSDLFQNLADTLLSFDIDSKWKNGRQVAAADIRRFSFSHFDFPIFRDSVFRKGVYASFQEFLDNNPSSGEYEIGMEGNRSVLYTKDGAGASFYNHKAWGVCDGKSLYVMLEGYLFPIFRDQNAFYLSGFIETNGNTDEPPMMVAGQPNTYEPRDNKNTIKRQTRVFAIDPDEGTVY